MAEKAENKKQIVHESNEYAVPYRLAAREKKAARWLAPVWWLLLFAIWETTARLGFLPAIYLPAPTVIITELFRLLATGELLPALGASAERWLIGVVGGGLCGLLLALGAGTRRNLHELTVPLVHFLYPVPKIAMLPLFILWLGIGEEPKWVIIGLGVFFPVFISTLQGIRHIPRIFYEVAAVYPTSNARFLRKIVFPAVLPSIFAGLRLGCGTALVLLVAAEMIAADTGIGALILHFGDLMLTHSLLACVLLLSLAGLFVQWTLQYLERLAIPWKV